MSNSRTTETKIIWRLEMSVQKDELFKGILLAARNLAKWAPNSKTLLNDLLSLFPKEGDTHEEKPVDDDPDLSLDDLDKRTAVSDATVGVLSRDGTSTIQRLNKLAGVCTGGSWGGMEPGKFESEGTADGDWLQCPICRKTFVYRSKHKLVI